MLLLAHHNQIWQLLLASVTKHQLYFLYLLVINITCNAVLLCLQSQKGPCDVDSLIRKCGFYIQVNLPSNKKELYVTLNENFGWNCMNDGILYGSENWSTKCSVSYIHQENLVLMMNYLCMCPIDGAMFHLFSFYVLLDLIHS